MQVLEWTMRAAALEPAGAVACGRSAGALLARLATFDETRLHRLSVVAARELVVVIGPGDAIPWVDGIRYCAPDPSVRDLWLPTHMLPRLSPDLVHAALAARLQRTPLLLWNEPEQIVPLDRPASMSAALLADLVREIG
jgi:hypothetical protein